MKKNTTFAASDGTLASYTLTKRQLLDFTGDNCIIEHHKPCPDDALRIACSAMSAAAQDLKVLCHATDLEAVDPSDFGMMLLRIASRLEASADVVYRWQEPQKREGTAER